jgi:hypothetical protein
MSKTLWHTIQIKVPAEMVELTKSGKISVKRTLTKTFNISRSQKQPAIKLIPSSDNKAHVVNDGKEWDLDELNSRMAKAKALENKNKNKNVFEPEIKQMMNLNKFEGNIIKRARELGQAKKEKKEKILKFGDIHGTFNETEWKGLYNKAMYSSMVNDVYKNIVNYYWENAYTHMEEQTAPTDDELKSVSDVLYRITPKYYKIQTIFSNGNVRSASELLWSVIDSITEPQYKIIMKIAYFDGKNKSHKYLNRACNYKKKQLSDDEEERLKQRRQNEAKWNNRTPEEIQKRNSFVKRINDNELISFY